MIYYYYGIVRKLSLRKVINFVKLVLGYHYSKLTKQAVQLGMPAFISVEPTTSCNLRCPQCPSGLRSFSRPTGMLDGQFFDTVIAQLKNELHSLTFYFQGEPYLHADFLNMVKRANDQGIYTITSTNAHYLTEENARRTVESGLDKLVISVDGVDQQTYEQYRVGGSLTKVIEGTREILKQKKLMGRRHPHVVWQFVVFKPNQMQVAEVQKLGRELGVGEIKIKTAQIYDFENGSELIPDLDEYSRYARDKNGKYHLKNKLLDQCWRMWQGCVITWDGKIVPCCFDKDAEHKVGDLYQESFRQAWFSEAYNRFRRSVLTGRKNIDICKNCSEGTKVWSTTS